MKIFCGKSVFGGVAAGTIRLYKKDEQKIKRERIEDAEAEVARYNMARNEAVEQLLRKLVNPMRQYLRFIR